MYKRQACGGTIVDCDATSVCNLGTCGDPQGLGVWSVPLTMATGTQSQRYAILFPTNPDMTNATVTVRMYAPGATGGQIAVYFSDADDSSTSVAPNAPRLLADLALGWTDQTFSVGGSAGSFDATHVKQITFEVSAGTGAGPWTNPTVIYIDGARSSNHIVNETFSTRATTVFPPLPATIVISGQQQIAGSTLDWVDAMP